MMTDPNKIIETIQRKQIEEDVYQAAMRIWANQESYMQPQLGKMFALRRTAQMHFARRRLQHRML